MVLRLKMTLAFTATALMAVVVSYLLAAMVKSTVLAALLSLIVAGALGAGVGYVFGGTTAQALSDLNNVILRLRRGAPNTIADTRADARRRSSRTSSAASTVD